MEGGSLDPLDRHPRMCRTFRSVQPGTLNPIPTSLKTLPGKSLSTLPQVWATLRCSGLSFSALGFGGKH